jgi:hypothetical protein
MIWPVKAILIALIVQLFVVAMVYTEPLINRVWIWRLKHRYRYLGSVRYVRKSRPAQVVRRSR